MSNTRFEFKVLEARLDANYANKYFGTVYLVNKRNMNNKVCQKIYKLVGVLNLSPTNTLHKRHVYNIACNSSFIMPLRQSSLQYHVTHKPFVEQLTETMYL